MRVSVWLKYLLIIEFNYSSCRFLNDVMVNYLKNRRFKCEKGIKQ